MSSFLVPQQYAGKTLQQIGDQLGAGNLEGIASWAGIRNDVPLTAGQAFNAPDDPGSSGVQFLQKNFTPQAQAQQQQASNILRESSQNAINTLQSGAGPLEQRYGDLTSNIRATTEQEVGRANVTSARELAARGISTNSTFADEYSQSKRLPIQTAGQGQEAAAQLSAQQAVENRNSAIANIQQATGLNEVNAAMEAYRQAESSRQFSEQQRQFNETLSFQRDQANRQTPTDPYAQFKTLGEGQTLIDLLSGNAVYSVPKTYKSGGDGNNNPGGI